MLISGRRRPRPHAFNHWFGWQLEAKGTGQASKSEDKHQFHPLLRSQRFSFLVLGVTLTFTSSLSSSLVIYYGNVLEILFQEEELMLVDATASGILLEWQNVLAGLVPCSLPKATSEVEGQPLVEGEASPSSLAPTHPPTDETPSPMDDAAELQR